ncbi:unnamed protein product [Alopecurus aequalis]
MSSSSATQSRWPEYGAVPMRRCPDCPRPEALKRMMLKKCSHFECIDQYVDRLESDGHIDMSDAATRDLILPPFAVERPNFSGGRGAPAERPMPTGRITRIAERAAFAELPVEAEVNQELKKVKKLLRQMVDLQKQANLMAGAFYSCIIALFFFYLLFIRR